jgi:nitroreductase
MSSTPATGSVLNLISSRRSYYAFKPDPIDDAKLFRLFQAAGQAASSYNEQPWRFVVARHGDPAFEKIYAGLIEWNQLWSKPAAVLVVALAVKNFAQNGTPNAHSWYDLGQAVGQLSIQAELEGLNIHQAAGFDHAIVHEAVDAPADVDAAVVFALGYKGDSNALPDAAKDRDLAFKTRKPLGEYVFADKYGKPIA